MEFRVGRMAWALGFRFRVLRFRVVGFKGFRVDGFRV